MLEPVSAMTTGSTPRGFTITEMMLVVAIVVVLAALAAPTFQTVLDRQRIRSAASNLNTDIQYARSEAVRKNDKVTMSFSASTTPWCYGIVTGTAACDCTTAGSCALKTVTGSEFRNVTMTLAPSTDIGFTVDPRQGQVSAIAGGGSGAATSAIAFGSTSTTDAQVLTRINSLGRVLQCAPSGANLPGYVACN
jgi:type IV fimbrial biogenesis protein FimT